MRLPQSKTGKEQQIPRTNKNESKLRMSKLVKVTFTDPTEFDTRFDDDGPVECVTVGWLTESSKEKVKLTWLYDK